MNQAVRSSVVAATSGGGGGGIPRFAACTPAASFHSTPVCERKRRTHWNTGTGFSRSKKFNYYASRARKFESKRSLLHNISEYAEYLFQSWRDDSDRSNSPSNDDPSWFRGPFYSKGTRKQNFGSHEPQRGSYGFRRKGGIEFCSSDDDEVETIFRSSFGGERCFYWSFHNSDDFRSRHSNHRSSWNSRYESEEETDALQSDLTSERLALGLSASGPLKLEEVKNAYRACALRWHPDRHEGSSKILKHGEFSVACFVQILKHGEFDFEYRQELLYYLENLHVPSSASPVASSICSHVMSNADLCHRRLCLVSS